MSKDLKCNFIGGHAVLPEAEQCSTCRVEIESINPWLSVCPHCQHCLTCGKPVVYEHVFVKDAMGMT